MNRKRVLIAGFYGARNVGDELMLKSIINKIDQDKFDVSILIAKNLKLNPLEEYDQKTLYYPETEQELQELSSNFDVFIWGGGAVIDDRDYNKITSFMGLAYILVELSEQILQHKGSVYVIGVSTNIKLSNQVFLTKLQHIINKSVIFSMRDKNSLATLSNSGLKTEKIILCDDPVVPDLRQPLPNIPSRFFNLSLVYIYNAHTIDSLINFTFLTIDLLSLIQKKRIRIKLVPFYDYCNNDFSYCEILANKICEKYHNVPVKIFQPLPCTLRLLEKAFYCSDLIITMRYHALLIGSLLGYRTLSLDYSSVHRHYKNKISDISSHYNRQIFSVTFSKIIPASYGKTLKSCLDISPTKIDKQLIENSRKTYNEFFSSLN